MRRWIAPGCPPAGPASLARPRRHHGLVALIAWGALCALAGCSDDTSGGTGAAADGATAADTPSADVGKSAWAQGYSLRATFHGGPAGGLALDLERDLFAIPEAFSFGSTHYVHGEVGFAVTDTFIQQRRNAQGVKIDVPVEIILNFGLVVGSSVNPVHTDKAGTYPFSCKPPSIRVVYKGTQYRSTCQGLTGSIDIKEYANQTGGRVAGSFAGRLESAYPPAGMTDECADAKAMCKKPEIYAEITGHFGFTLPTKADGGG